MATTKSRRAHRNWIGAVLLVLLILGLVHVYFWYWPRSRPGNPSSKSPVAGLVLKTEGPEMRLWVPFPHQNLAAVERRLGSLETASLALEEVLGAQPLGMPSFGPFRLPPAREMAIATDFDGGSFVAMARVYPVAARLFRVAGWLASNPWMAGGEVALGGRRVQVEWRGSLWLATTEGTFLQQEVSPVEVGRSLALIRLRERLGPVSAGLFRFTVEDRRWVLSSNLRGDAAAIPDLDVWRIEGVPLSWTRIEGEGGAREVRSLMALSQPSKATTTLPPLMVAQAGGTEPMRLPGERILEAVGAEVFRRTIERWQLSAFEESSLRLGDLVVERLEGLYGDAETGADTTVGFLDLKAARRVMLEVGRALQQVPVIGEAEARRWLILASVLDEMDDDSLLSVRLADPDHLVIEIAPKPYN